MGRRKNLRIIAALVAFAVAQTYVPLSFAAPDSFTASAVPLPQLLARLTTKDNRAISVNGVSASSGASVANDAIIETPVNVDAIVDLGSLGSLDIDQETRIKLEYDGNCVPGPGNSSGGQGPALQKCSVKITLYAGCVTAHYKQGAYFMAVTEQQMLIADSDKSRRHAGTFKVCAGTGAPAGAAAVNPGPSTIALIALAALIIGGGGVILPLITNPSTNPSPSAPPSVP
jgi:hypothetical protein